MSKTEELYERVRDLAKQYDIVIVTPHQPRPPYRVIPWQDPPEIIFVDYLDIIKPNRSES